MYAIVRMEFWNAQLYPTLIEAVANMFDGTVQYNTSKTFYALYQSSSDRFTSIEANPCLSAFAHWYRREVMKRLQTTGWNITDKQIEQICREHLEHEAGIRDDYSRETYDLIDGDELMGMTNNGDAIVLRYWLRHDGYNAVTGLYDVMSRSLLIGNVACDAEKAKAEAEKKLQYLFRRLKVDDNT